MNPAKPLAILLGAALCAQAGHAQSSAAAKTIPVSAYTKTAKPEKSEFPQWARDLRRAEIIAFGSFPFTMFASTFFVDTWRYFDHDRNARYAPWPMKSAGAVEMDKKEHLITLFSAIAGSVAIALADHIIVRVKRAKLERQRQALPEGEAIILRKPWPPDEPHEETDTEAAAIEDAGEAGGTP